MKHFDRPLLLPFFTAVLLLLAPTARGGSPAGIVIYKDSPRGSDALAIAVEFAQVERFGRITHVVRASDGEKMRLTNDVVAEVLTYPNFSVGGYTTDQQIDTLRQQLAMAETLGIKYPRSKSLMDSLAQKLQVFIQKYDQGEVWVDGRWQKKGELAQMASGGASGVSLTITTPEGSQKTYTGVKVTGQAPDALRIMHSGGAASIPFEQLSKEDQEKYGFNEEEALAFREKSMEKPEVAAVPVSPKKEADAVMENESAEEMEHVLIGGQPLEVVNAEFGEPIGDAFMNKFGLPTLKYKKDQLDVVVSFRDGGVSILAFSGEELGTDDGGYNLARRYLKDSQPVYSNATDDGLKVLISYQCKEGSGDHVIEPVKQSGTLTILYD